MNLHISFRSELLKISGRPTLFLMIILCLLLPAVMIIVFDSDSIDDFKILDGDPWTQYFLNGTKPMGFVFLPFFILMTCTLLPQLEYRNNTWKQLFSSPQSYAQIYISKFLIVQFLILIYLLSYIPLMTLSAAVTNIIHPAFGFSEHALDPVPVLGALTNSYVSALGISTLQFVIGMRSKSFILPIAIGFALWLTSCMLLFDYKWEHADKSPYLFTLLVQFPKYQKKLPEYLLSSATWAIIILAIGCFDFTRRKVRG